MPDEVFPTDGPAAPPPPDGTPIGHTSNNDPSPEGLMRADNLGARLKQMGYDPLRDFTAADFGDGLGPRLIEWNHSDPMPTADSLPPLKEYVPPVVSDRQFFQALALAGKITPAEALAAVKTGELPDAFIDALGSLPTGDAFGLEMLLSGATTFERAHPATAILAGKLGMSEEQTDRLWRDAAKL